jgi:hypothetical protein
MDEHDIGNSTDPSAAIPMCGVFVLRMSTSDHQYMSRLPGKARCCILPLQVKCRPFADPCPAGRGCKLLGFAPYCCHGCARRRLHSFSGHQLKTYQQRNVHNLSLHIVQKQRPKMFISYRRPSQPSYANPPWSTDARGKRKGPMLTIGLTLPSPHCMRHALEGQQSVGETVLFQLLAIVTVMKSWAPKSRMVAWMLTNSVLKEKTT